jgi:hypothetical protein
MKNITGFVLSLAIGIAAGEIHNRLHAAAPTVPAPITITATDALGNVRTGTATWTSMDYNANAITIAYTHDTLTCNGFEP